ncbi:MAG: LytTR family DNA-binding domain-containing protein [Saprospiraceae bacterium]|nr:LytTR family DNA-binding domain-containing protein [Saprospiraceae bacterium]
MKIKTIVVDPQFKTRQTLRNVLQNHEAFKLKGAAWDAADAKMVISKVAPDLLFLNADLPDQSGFSLIDGLDPEKRPQLVIMSTKESYAMRALQYSALDFLKLPLDQKCVDRTLKKIIDVRNIASTKPLNGEAKDEENTRIAIKSGKKVVLLHFDDIRFIKGSGYYIEFTSGAKKHLMRESMSGIMSRLPSRQFIRIHRSAIINLHFLEEIIRRGPKTFFVRMAGGHELRISSSYKKDLFDLVMH